VALRKQAVRRGGTVTLVAPSASCMRLLRVVAFDKVFDIRVRL
jgi:hypothetical protein